MTVMFSDEEREWIEIKKFKWSIKDGCPSSLRDKIENKLKYLYKK